MESDYFWVKRDGWEISSLPKFTLYSAIASISFGVTVSCLMLTAIPFAVANILFMVAAATLLVPIISFAVMFTTCDYREISKELYDYLKEQRQMDKIEARMKFSDRVERISNFLHKYRNDKTPERDDSFDEGSETRNHSFLRRLITERFNSKKPSAVSHLLGKFNEDEDTESLIKRINYRSKSFCSDYVSISNTLL